MLSSQILYLVTNGFDSPRIQKASINFGQEFIADCGDRSQYPKLCQPSVSIWLFGNRQHLPIGASALGGGCGAWLSAPWREGAEEEEVVKPMRAICNSHRLRLRFAQRHVTVFRQPASSVFHSLAFAPLTGRGFWIIVLSARSTFARLHAQPMTAQGLLYYQGKAARRSTLRRWAWDSWFRPAWKGKF